MRRAIDEWCHTMIYLPRTPAYAWYAISGRPM